MIGEKGKTVRRVDSILPMGATHHDKRGTLNLTCVIALTMFLLGSLSGPAHAFAGQVGAQNLLAASVDPFIGTGKGPGPTPFKRHENLFPGAAIPFGMVQLSPDTESHMYGYHYYQHTIQGFSMTHLSGAGCSDEGNVFFTPTTGPVETAITQFESPYLHSQESASPGYYRVMLSRWGINAQFTATDRTGFARFTFPAGKTENILVPISHTLTQTAAAKVQVRGDREITGYVVNHVFCGNKQTYKVYFAMIFSRPFTSFGTWQGEKDGGPGKVTVSSHLATQTHPGQWVGAYASWGASSHPQTIVARVGISYVDLAGAENNLKQEAVGKTFNEVRHDAWTTWNKALSVIQVSGGSAYERRVFYTALYHCLLMPSLLSDADGRYIGFDDKIHHVAPGHLYYTNFSGWDVYRSEMPLLALIEPQRVQDMDRSLVLMYQQGGWVVGWPFINRYTHSMVGSPLTTVMAMDWLDGLHGFDIKTAWKGMELDATEAPPPGRPYTGEEGIRWINKIHYVPADKIKYGSVSMIQEDCIAYASLYYLAKDLGKIRAAKMFYKRAFYYRNVFNHKDYFFRPRNSDGKRVPNFDPAQEKHAFVEGSGWHYQWLAPADLAWLIHAVGRNRFNQRLLKFFSYEKPGWYGEYYNPYNETDLEAPFEFNFSGMPWETQRVVRRILRENYRASPNGVSGTDDCGEMSSWAVMSMMGIYTVDPASLAYELVSPVFSKIVIHLQAPYQGKTFTIKASSDPLAKPYIQSVKLDGQAHTKNWIRFGAMSGGGTLQFVLGPSPNKAWGSAPGDVPPSLSKMAP